MKKRNIRIGSYFATYDFATVVSPLILCISLNDARSSRCIFREFPMKYSREEIMLTSNRRSLKMETERDPWALVIAPHPSSCVGTTTLYLLLANLLVATSELGGSHSKLESAYHLFVQIKLYTKYYNTIPEKYKHFFIFFRMR